MINFTSIFSWGAAPGAASYKCRALDGVNVPVAISDPATNDPDGDGFVDTVGTSVPVALWLAAKALGPYKFRVAPVDANGNVGTEASITVSYDAPVIDPATLSVE